MKIRLCLLGVVVSGISVFAALAKQPEFVIVNHVDPESTAEFNKMVSAGFNVRGGFHPYRDQTYQDNIAILQNSNSVIPSLVEDKRLTNSTAETAVINKVLSDYTGQNIFGYRFLDEPFGNSVTDALKNINNLKTISSQSFTYINLHPIGGHWGNLNPTGGCKSSLASCYTAYEEYFKPFFKSSLDAISFDFYVLYDNNPSTSGAGPNANSNYPLRYDFRNLPYPHFYYMNNLFASNAKSYSKYYWGFGLATEHAGNPDRYYASGPQIKEQVHYPRPSLQTARFYVSAALVYGAKGFNWFTYQLPGSDFWKYYQAPSNNTSIYNTIRFVNQELKNAGPIMMAATWQGTGHGSAVDPFSGEKNLKTISQVLSGNQGTISSDAINSLAVGVFQTWMGKYMLVVFNKNLSEPTTVSGTVSNTLGSNMTVQNFTKRTARWEDVAIGNNQYRVTIAPGDYAIIMVNDPNAKMIGDTKGDGTQTRAVFGQDKITFQVGKKDGTYTEYTEKGFGGGYLVAGEAASFLEGDFNGDGKIDLIHIITRDNITRVWYANSNGVPSHPANKVFVPWSGYAVTSPSSYLVGDFNGDGKDDLIHLMETNTNIWRGTSSGFQVSGWVPFADYWIGTDKEKYKVGDFNGDGRDDVVHITSTEKFRMWTWNTASTTPSFLYTGNQIPLRADGSAWTGYVLPTSTKKWTLLTADADLAMDMGWLPDGQKSHIWMDYGTNFMVSSIRYSLLKQAENEEYEARNETLQHDSQIRIQTTEGGLEISGDRNLGRIQIYDLKGRTIAHIVVDGTKASFDLARGLYSIKVQGKAFAHYHLK